jgi:uncharacterized protein (TIGR03435 family)
MNDTSSPKCPQCGTPLPVDAPRGLCPNCLIALNLKTETVFTDDTPAAQPPLPPEQIAPHFPQLEILECLGRGGMGVVYKARQNSLNRLVALKLLAPERVHDRRFAERFTREAQALAVLNHPNIVTIYDFGQAGGFYFLIMEFVDGVNLRQLLQARKFTPEEALAIVPPLCDALQFAHDRGIVHRDIKPENLLLDKAGRIKVADFGIAKMLGTATGPGNSGEPVGPETATQAAVGTPSYSAPEQKSDPQRVDSRADIYSLGVVFYEMLTGELPGKKIEAPSKKVQIDVRLDEVVLRALEKAPELRWQKASDLRTQVETITQTPGSQTAPRPETTPVDLKLMRRKIMIWGVALAAAAIEMGLNARPRQYGVAIGMVGVNLFAAATTLALVFGGSWKMLHLAKRLVLVDGILMASAAIWVAYSTPTLPRPWQYTIIAACLGGIAYCLSCWGRSDTQTGQPSNLREWTTTKTAIVIGVGVLLAAGTSAVAIQEFRSPSIEEVFKHASEGGYLVQAPPVAFVRHSQGGLTGVTSSDTGRMVGHGVTLGALLSLAYGSPTMHFHWSEDRVIFPPEVADEKFDFLLTVPDHRQEALQAEIKNQLGVTAHRELREADVLVLTVSNPNATGLAVAKDEPSSDRTTERGGYEFFNEPISYLRDFLENKLGKPVIDETELTQSYSGNLKLSLPADKNAKLGAIQTALAGQLGLQLVPRHEPVEMLVVEIVK